MKLRFSAWKPEESLRVRAQQSFARLGHLARMERVVELRDNYFFAPIVPGGPMNNDEKAAKFWRDRVVPKEREISEELRVCKKEGRRTKRYENLVKDQAKLKAEYEEIVGGKPYDPTNLQDVETAAERTTRRFLGYK